MEENTYNFNNFEARQEIGITSVIITAILGIVFSLCCAMGLSPAIIAVILASNKMNLYKQNPSKYFGIENLKVAQVVAYISLGINILILIWIVYSLVTTDWLYLLEEIFSWK